VEALWSDAWFLVAVDLANQSNATGLIGEARGELADVIAAADAIDHAILLPDEIQHAVRLLVPAGMLRLSGDRFEVTANGRALCKQAERAEVAGTMGRVHRLLKELPQPSTAGMDWKLDPAAHASANQTYEARIRREAPELGP
jgi:hypothetical protein